MIAQALPDQPAGPRSTGTLLYTAATLAFWVVAAWVLLYQLGDFPLENWDEAIYAEVNHEMVTNGDLLTPHYNREPYFNKPPLYFWLGHLPMRLLGFSEFSARLPGVIFGALTLWVTLGFGRALGGRAVGLVAGLSVLTCSMFLENGSRHATPDSLLTLLTVAAYWAQWTARQCPRARHLMALLAGAAFLTKGAAAFPLWLGLAAVHFLSGDARVWRLRDYVWAVLLALAVFVPWYAAQAVLGGDAFWRKHVYWSVWQRATVTGYIAPTHVHGPLYFTKVLLRFHAHLWPLLPAVALAIACSRRAAAPRESLHRRALPALTLALGVLAPLLLFSAAQNKAWWYLIPAVPLIGIAVGLAVATAARCVRGRPVLLALLVLAGLGALAGGGQAVAITLRGQHRDAWKVFGGLAHVAKSVERHAAALHLENPILVTTHQQPTLAAYTPFYIALDPLYAEHLTNGSLRAQNGRAVLVLDKPRAIQSLPPRLEATILESKSGYALAWIKGAARDP